MRTGTKPYSGAYTYDDAGRRLTALVITNSLTTHYATYSYDGAGRLLQVVDSATSLIENYVWNADGTLASYPGPGYTRLLEYDEEGRLVRIKRNAGGTITTAYEYGYGYDGGRRWRKDYLQNQWTWYPCGVACSAGELVEQQSDLTGATWTTIGQQLRVGAGCASMLLRRNSDNFHSNLSDISSVTTDPTGAISSSVVYDEFSVQQYSSAITPPCAIDDELSFLQARGFGSPSEQCLCNCGGTCKCDKGFKVCCKTCDLKKKRDKDRCTQNFKDCMKKADPTEHCHEQLSICKFSEETDFKECQKRCGRQYKAKCPK